MSATRDHHHVPQFHLSKWIGEDGKLIQWGRVPRIGKLVRTPVTPAQTGYVPNLYAQDLVPDSDVHLIETDVLGPIETKASVVADKLIGGGLPALTEDDFITWARFVNAAVFRTPDALALARDRAPKILESNLGGHIPEFEALKGGAAEKSLLEWTRGHQPTVLANFALGAIRLNIEKGANIDRILACEWIVVNFAATTRRRLMLSDRPVIKAGRLGTPNSFIAMPLSPELLFIAADVFATAEKLLSRSPDELVRLTNISSLLNSQRFAYGEAEASFVDQHLLTNERKTLVD